LDEKDRLSMTISLAIVDDDEAILDAMHSAMESVGWSVHTYRSGDSFLKESSDVQLDCLILDPHLPGISGPDVARSAVKKYGRIPIIGLTASPTSPITEEVRQAGAIVMLTKPISLEELLNHVSTAIKRFPE